MVAPRYACTLTWTGQHHSKVSLTHTRILIEVSGGVVIDNLVPLAQQERRVLVLCSQPPSGGGRLLELPAKVGFARIWCFCSPGCMCM